MVDIVVFIVMNTFFTANHGFARKGCYLGRRQVCQELLVALDRLGLQDYP